MKQKGTVEFEGIRPNTNRELMDMVHERDKVIREMRWLLEAASQFNSSDFPIGQRMVVSDIRDYLSRM